MIHFQHTIINRSFCTICRGNVIPFSAAAPIFGPGIVAAFEKTYNEQGIS